MSWIEKHQPTPFDDRPLPGLFFLDGDLLAHQLQIPWTAGQKLAMVVFPSGREFELWETSDPDAGGIVHIFGEMDLPYNDIRDRAFEHANDIAEQCGYAARRVGESGLEVRGQDRDEHFLITYDPETQQIRDITRKRSSEPPPVHRAHQLMTDELRERLPQLGANEEQGLDAPAPVKYFTPDGGWTWYVSEFDGEDLFFGLVIGLEIELGYFSLSELRAVRGSLGLPIERDLHYEPRSLRELQAQHCRERGENGV